MTNVTLLRVMIFKFPIGRGERQNSFIFPRQLATMASGTLTIASRQQLWSWLKVSFLTSAAFTAFS